MEIDNLTNDTPVIIPATEFGWFVVRPWEGLKDASLDPIIAWAIIHSTEPIKDDYAKPRKSYFHASPWPITLDGLTDDAVAIQYPNGNVLHFASERFFIGKDELLVFLRSQAQAVE